MIKRQAKTIKKKTAISRKARKRPSDVYTDLSQNCRCKCSSVCSIEGPDSIKSGKKKTYTLEVNIARNLGCRAVTSGCSHDSTVWAKGGQRGAAVTLEDERTRSVKAKVAPGTAAGTFWLQAQPDTSCKCKGPGDIVRNCSDQNERVTINVT